MSKPARVCLTAVTFVLVLVYCFPYSGEDSDPPHLYNAFNQEIWSGSTDLFALAVAAISAGIVWLATSRLRRWSDD